MKSLIIFFSLFFSTFLIAQTAPKYSLEQLHKELQLNLLGDAQKTAWRGLEVVDPKNDLEYLEVVKAYWMCVSENGTQDQKSLWFHQLDSLVSITKGTTQMILASWAYEHLVAHKIQNRLLPSMSDSPINKDIKALIWVTIFNHQDYEFHLKKYAQLSLKNMSRGKTSVAKFSTLLLFKDEHDTKYIEDLLLQRYLNLPTNSLGNFTERIENYAFDDQYWSTQDPWEIDSLTPWILIQQRKSFHQIENNLDFALDYHLKALALISKDDQSSDHYTNALKEVISIAKQAEPLALAYYELGFVAYQLKQYEACERILLECFKNYPNTPGAVKAQELYEKLKQIDLTLTYHQRFLSNTPSWISFKGRNLHLISWEILEVSPEDFLKYHYLNNANDNTWKKDLKGNPWEISGIENQTYVQQSTKNIFPKEKDGFYLLIARSAAHPTFFKLFFIQINEIDLVRIEEEKEKIQVWNTQSNEVLPKTKISLFHRSNKKKIATLTTDEKGIASLPVNKNYYRDSYFLQIKSEHQTYFELRSSYDYNHPKSKADDYWENDIQILSDRNIYRPGDTVHFKVISYKRNTPSQTKEIKPFHSEMFFLQNPNYEEIDTLTLNFNDFGSASAYFICPKSGLTGNYRILNENYNSISFKVENYKRPQLKIEIQNIKTAIKQGDSVEIEIKVQKFNGTPIQNAEVAVAVDFRHVYERYGRADLEIDDFKDTLISDQEGIGKTKIYLPVERANHYEIKLSAIAVSAGETQETNKTFQIDTLAYKIKPTHPSVIKEGQNNIGFEILNRYNEKVNAPLALKFYKLKQPEAIKPLNYFEDWSYAEIQNLQEKYPQIDWTNEWDLSQWSHDQLVAQENWSEQSKKSFTDLNLKPGVYQLICTVQNEESKFYLTVHPKKKGLTLSQPIALAVNYNTEEKVIHIQANTEALKTKAFLGYYWQGTYYTEAISAGQKNWTKTLSVTEGDKNARYSFSLFTNFQGRTITVNDQVFIPQESKDFTFEFVSFRDEMTPGSPQQITLKIKRKAGPQVPMELIAAMYDASLDAINYRHYFTKIYDHSSKYFSYNTYTPNSPLLRKIQRSNINNPMANNIKKCHQNFNYFKYQLGHFNILEEQKELLAFHPLQFTCDSIHELPFNYYSLYYDLYNSNIGTSLLSNEMPLFKPFEMAVSYKRSGGINEMLYEAELSNFVIASDDERADVQYSPRNISNSIKKLKSVGDKSNKDNSADLEGTPTKATHPSFRSNFKETAFFLPHLYADSNGNYEISFQAPEALSSWHLNLLAHSKTMQQLSLQKSLQTLKDLMVQIQPIRFVRYGDQFRLPVLMFNTGAEDVQGKYTISFFDEDQKLIVQIAGDTLIPAKGQLDLFAYLKAPDQGNYITMEASFSAQNISDGERHIIPLLNNKTIVQKSKNIYANEEGTKNFAFADYITSFNNPEIEHLSYQVNFTTHPIWNVLQSLPYLMEYPHECAEQTFHKWYANQLSAHIVDHTPEIAHVFKIWEAQGASKSPLRSHENLKSILLSETPWVMEAQSEEAQQAYIAELMNSFKLKQELNKNFNKLEKFQNNDGGFVWFNGMKSSFWVTKIIVKGMLQLNQLKIIDIQYFEYRKMISKTKDFMYESYIDVKDHQYPIDLDYWLIAAQTQDDRILKHPKISVLIQNQINSYVKQDFQSQAKLALICHYSGQTEMAQKIFNSLWNRKHYDPEMGYYWKEAGLGQRTHLEIERQNTLISLAHLMNAPSDEIEKAQWWLLHQKRNQKWENTVLSAQSIFSLMLGKTSYEAPKSIQIWVGKDDLVSTADSTSQTTGYYQKRWTTETMEQRLGAIKIESSGSTPIWGGLHWSYTQSAQKVTASNNMNLNIKRSYFIQNASGQWVEANEEPLKQGQKVQIVLDFSLDRHMEFLHISDPRPAAFEPIQQTSGYRYHYKKNNYLGYYQTFKDASQHFFIQSLSAGQYQVSYEVFVNYDGQFQVGPCLIESMYNPDFKANGVGKTVKVIAK